MAYILHIYQIDASIHPDQDRRFQIGAIEVQRPEDALLIQERLSGMDLGKIYSRVECELLIVGFLERGRVKVPVDSVRQMMWDVEKLDSLTVQKLDKDKKSASVENTMSVLAEKMDAFAKRQEEGE